MDPFTQKLLERTRARREALNQKMAETPEAAPRKRRPLSENNGQNELEVPVSPAKKASPKRHCLREPELEVHVDTPAVRGVKSRMQQLVANREDWNNDAGVTDEGTTTAAPAPPPVLDHHESSPVPETRKGRFAKLAQNINNWEDDLSHPVITKEEPKKKVWQPPKPVEPVEKMKSPVKSKQSLAKTKSTTSFTPNSSTDSPKGGKPLAHTYVENTQKEVVNPLKFISPQRNIPVNPVPKPVRVGAGSESEGREDEPTAKPVTSRMAIWEKKTTAAEKEAADHRQKSAEFQASKRCRTKSGGMWQEKMDAAAAMLTGEQTRKALEADKAQEAWQEAPVVSRKSVWEEKIKKAEKSSEEEITQLPEIETMDADDHHRTMYSKKSTGRLPSAEDESPPAAQVVPKSPGPQRRQTSQMQQALKMLQTQASDKDKDIAQKMKAEREAEMQALKNRFHNGILKENVSSETSEASQTETESENDFEPQPPPRGNNSRKRVREVVTDHVRAANNERGSNNADFESNLSAMGFEIQSTADLNGKKSHVACLSLTPKPAPQAQPKTVSFEDSFYSPGNDKSLKVFEPPCVSYDNAATRSYSRLPHVQSTSSVSSTESESSRDDNTRQHTLQRKTSSTDSESSYACQEPATSEETEDADDESDNEAAAIAEIDNLLDEAMSDEESEVEEPPAKKPSPPPPQAPERKSKYRVSVDSSVKPSYNLRSSQESLTSEDEPEKPLVYSIDMYRSTSTDSWAIGSRHKSNRPAPKITVVRHSEHSRQAEVHQEEALPYIPEKDDKEKIKELHGLVNQEQNVIMQTSNALNQCCMGNSSFAGSAEQVECNKLLLIACQKRQAYLAEIERLKNPKKYKRVDSGLARGSLTISDIRLPVKKDFVNRIGTTADTSVHFFILLLRNGPQVIVTQMLSTHDPGFRGSLDFPNLIKLNDIAGDFSLVLEVYSMSITKEPAEGTKKKDKKFTPKKLLKGSKMSAYQQSPGGAMAVRTTNFTQITSVTLSMRSLNKTTFNLDKVPFLSPLQGLIHLKLRCLMEVNIEERGFLNMFEDISGFGAWHRRWFALSKNKLCFWKYPDEERNKEPMGFIDLKCCVNDSVGLISRDVCARPNTFELLTMRPPAAGDRNTLVSSVSGRSTQTRHMLSADTRDDRVQWCNKLNEALKNLRMWYSEALHPMPKGVAV